MADDGGVWVKLPTATSATGGGIYTKVADPAGDKWVEIGASAPGLEGGDDWATVTSVSGTYKRPRHEYNDGVTDWVAYEFTDNGSFTIDGEEGLVEFLLVASASRNSNSSGGKGGGALEGLERIAASTTTTLSVGKTTDTSIGESNGSTPSRLTHANGEVLWAGDLGGWSAPARAGNGGIQPDGSGIYSSIFGPKRGFGGGAQANGNPYGVTPAVPNSGAASTNTSQAWPSGEAKNQGIVGIRVPKAYADNVQETFHGWDSFALVTDGVVTDVTRVPDNEPHTLDAEWVLCSADVQVGWDFVGGVFSEPTATEMPAVPDDV